MYPSVVTKVNDFSETYLKDDKHRPVSWGGAIESRDSKECIVSGVEQHATFLEQVAIKVCFEMPTALAKQNNREILRSTFDKFSTRMQKLTQESL